MLKIPWVDANTSNIWHLVTGAMAWLHSVRTLPFRYVVKTDDDALVCPNNLILAIRGATERLEKLPPLHFLGEPYFVLTPSTNMTSSTRPIGMHYPLGALYALSRSLLSKIAPALQLDGAGRYNRGCDFAENKEDFCIGLLVCRIGTGNSQRLHSLEEIPQALNFSGKGPCLSKRRGVLFTSLVSQMRQRKMSFPRYQSTDDRRLATTCADTNFIVFHRLRDNEVFKECLRHAHTTALTGSCRNRLGSSQKIPITGTDPMRRNNMTTERHRQRLWSPAARHSSGQPSSKGPTRYASSSQAGASRE